MRGVTGIVIALALLVSPSAAQAAQRYAAPAGVGPEPCAQAAPCSLKEAVSKAKTADEVIVTGGTYTVTELPSSGPGVNNLYVHGDFGGPPPRLNASGVPFAIAIVGMGSRLAYMDLSNTGVGSSGTYCSEGVTVERIRAVGSGEASSGITGISTCKLLDSLALASGKNSVGLINGGNFFTATSIVRNVTAIATGTGSKGVSISCFICGFMGSANFDLKNTIAAGDAADLETSSGGTIAVSNSNFDKAVPNSPGSITDAGGNQTAPPLFVNAAAGDYRQAAGSPTIDAGTSDQLGALDLEGNARVVGSAPDIGAFEFVPPPPPPGQIQSLAVAPKAFRTVNAGEAILSARKKTKAPIGTTVTYTLSGKATAEFFVERRVAGRRVKGKCTKVTKANRKRKKCVIYRLIKTGFAHSGQAGPTQFKFSGRVGGKPLKPGGYRLVGITSAATQVANFKILK